MDAQMGVLNFTEIQRESMYFHKFYKFKFYYLFSIGYKKFLKK